MNWKQCTSKVHGQREMINLDNVAKLTPRDDGGTFITFVGMPKDVGITIVKETPEEILSGDLLC